MKISAIVDGNPVIVVDVQRVGSVAYITFISNSTGDGGGLVCKPITVSAGDNPYIFLSTSATWVA